MLIGIGTFTSEFDRGSINGLSLSLSTRFIYRVDTYRGFFRRAAGLGH